MGTELPDCSTLIKAQFSTLATATERGTSDETEATHLHACTQPADIDKVRSCRLRYTVAEKGNFYFDLILLRFDFRVVEFCSASIFDKSRRDDSVLLRF